MEQLRLELRQHLHVNRFDLMRERADAGKAHGEVRVVRISETDARGLNEQAYLVGIRERRLRVGDGRCTRECSRFYRRNYRLVERAIRQPHPTLEALDNRPRRLKDDRNIEVSR